MNNWNSVAEDVDDSDNRISKVVSVSFCLNRSYLNV